MPVKAQNEEPSRLTLNGRTQTDCTTAGAHREKLGMYLESHNPFASRTDSDAAAAG